MPNDIENTANERSNIVRPRVPLPATTSDMVAKKTIKDTRTLNDHVDDMHVLLFDGNENYRTLLDAVYDEDATEGSLSYDNYKACEIIRDTARSQGKIYLGSKKLGTINKSLQVVLRRYHMTRKERAVTVDGEQVPNQNNNNGE